MRQHSAHKEILPHLFRQEYTKMTAVLCRHFGLSHIEIAEDIASETFLKACENWAVNGMPENPTAWLYRVAMNKAKDHLKHVTIAQTKIKQAITPESEPTQQWDFDHQHIADSQLAMIFSVCDPGNTTEAQICLALQILCGFSINEISGALLTKPETIKKRLLRARANLRNNQFKPELLSKPAITLRLDTVLRTLYLLFNEGYFSNTNDLPIRKELCAEAIRLALILAENPLTSGSRVNALLALMCFQSSRLDARLNTSGENILFDQQDRSLWDKTLIEKGNYYLVNACDGGEISKYHLEAGIAYWHTAQTEENKWQYILRLYNELILIEYSPATALNRTFAYAMVYGNEQGIIEAEKLNLCGNCYYHKLLGYLYASIKIDEAITHYRKALALTRSASEKSSLKKEIAGLEKL